MSGISPDVTLWTALNSVLTCAVLIYAIKVENRFTKLETTLDLLIKIHGVKPKKHDEFDVD